MVTLGLFSRQSSFLSIKMLVGIHSVLSYTMCDDSNFVGEINNNKSIWFTQVLDNTM